jgi:hypothetical protein
VGFSSTNFIIDGINSEDLGINGCSIIRTDTEIQVPWISGKDILEDQIRYSNVPTFYGIQKKPLEFSLKFTLKGDEPDQFTSDRLYELGKIFGQDKYVSFQSCDYLGKMFYVIATNQVNLVQYGQYKGWYEVSLRCNAPYAWSLPQILTFDCTAATPTSAVTIEIENKSNVPDPNGDYCYYPEIWIDLLGSSTGVTLRNNSDGGRLFSFTGLSVVESLYINNQKKQIESSTTLYRLTNLTDKTWFRLVYGKNQIQVLNSCMLQFKCQYPLYM